MPAPDPQPADHDAGSATVAHGVAVVAASAAIGATRARRLAGAAATAVFLAVTGGLGVADLLAPPGARPDLVAAAVSTAQRSGAGLDPAWLFESPPPLPRHPVPPAMLELWARVPQLMFLVHVNEPFLRSCWQKGSGLTAAVGPDYPREFDVFTVPDGGREPRFRYRPDTTMPDGLTTNCFGFRGPDLAVDKPARTIRIACVGASATVDSHHFAWSYPELMQHWLDRWATARGLDLRFEVVNAAREAIRSADVRAIVQYEVLPLAVDYVVYYEGANQCGLADLLRHVQVEGAFTAGQPPPAVAADLPALAALAGQPLAGLRRHAANGRRVLSLAGFGDAHPEPDKPAQTVVLPAGLDERNPDPARAGEVLQLGAILADLDAMHRLCAAARARFVVASFCWMVEDGLLLDLAEGRSLWSHLNVECWPLRYATLRRLTDLQNAFFASWARARGVPFVDLAALMPRDPALYIDAVHASELGSRLRGWLLCAALVTTIEADLAAGAVPVPDRHPDARHPFLTPTRRLTAADLDAR